MTQQFPTRGHISINMKTLIWKDNMYPMSIATLFTIAKTWTQRKMSIDTRMDQEDVVHRYTMEYYSVIKKEWNNAIFNKMGGPRDYHHKWSKSDRERQISHIIYMWTLFLKGLAYLQSRNRFTNRNKFMVTKVEMQGEG